MNDDENQSLPGTSARARIFIAVTVALIFSFGVYVLLNATRPESGLISFSFLLVVPAAVCAFACYVADPLATRPLRFYMLMPLWLLLAIIAASFIILREGVICVVILSPLWLISGLAGAGIAYRLRTRLENGTTYCSIVLLIPLLVMQVEPFFPLPQADVAVTRS